MNSIERAKFLQTRLNNDDDLLRQFGSNWMYFAVWAVLLIADAIRSLND